MTLVRSFAKLLFVAGAPTRAGSNDLVLSSRALAFRGWRVETDEVVEALNVAGITAEVVETIIPAIIGGGLVVCETYVPAPDLAPALRIVAPIVRRQSPI